jgi:SPP1 gp7 family putative phage head morphogenesis protein
MAKRRRRLTVSEVVNLAGENRAAQEAAQRVAADVVTDVTASVRAGIRAAIVRSIREGIPPYDAARLIQPLIGLTDKQVHAVMNYRETLINAGHVPQRVVSLTDTYIEQKIAERARTIARTETMRALNAGERATWEAAIDEGLMDETEQREWIITPDDRLCDVCEAMDGKIVGVDEDFTLPTGETVEGPPAHPNCRCTTGITA